MTVCVCVPGKFGEAQSPPIVLFLSNIVVFKRVLPILKLCFRTISVVWKKLKSRLATIYTE